MDHNEIDYIKKNCKLFINPSQLVVELPSLEENSKSVVKFLESLRVPYMIDEGTNDKVVVNGSTNIVDFLRHIYIDDQDFLNICVAMKLPTVMDPIRVYLTDPDAVMPSKAHASDIGYDLSIISKVKDLTKNTALYETGVKMMAPVGYYLEIHPRSSISKTGYMLANSTGIIDPGYTGNLLVALTKIDQDAPDITFPAKMAQVIIRKAYMSIVEEQIIPEMTTRNEGGFGSTN